MNAVSYILIFIMIISSYSCSSSRKIIRSQNEMPKWISSIEKGYLVGEGEGSSFSIAKENALNSISLELTKTIAQKSSIKDIITSNNINTNNNINSKEEFTRKYVSKTFAPVINGISISKVEDFYWVKKRTKEGYLIRYYIRYSIPKTEIDILTKKWEIKYEKIIREVENILIKSERYKSVEKIINDYRTLISYEDFGDDLLTNRIKSQKSYLYHLLSRVDIKVKENRESFVSFCYSLDGNTISYSIGPGVKINNISDYSILREKNAWTLIYNPIVQNINMDYSIIIESDILGRKFKKHVDLQIIDGSINIEVLDPILIYETNYWFASDNTYFKIKIRSNNNNSFTINHIQLIPTEYSKNYWNGKLESTELEALNIYYNKYSINSEGVYIIEGKCDCEIQSWANIFNGRKASFSGKIIVTSKLNDKKKEIKFKNINVKLY